MRILVIVLFALFVNGLSATPANSRVVYGVVLPEALLTKKNQADLALQDARNPLLAHEKYISAIQSPHHFQSKHTAFAIVLALLAFLGLFRLSHPAYFRNMFRAFRNAGLSSRHLKEQLEQNNMAALLMNLFFCCSIALYLYEVLRYFNQVAPEAQGTALMLTGIIALSLAAVYLLRFVFLKVAGWLFQAPEAMNNYSFQIFLVNKILGIFLLPFTAVLAFGQGGWVQVSLFLSFVMIALLFLYRYFRSGATFRYFVLFSRFHFFLYLCASELLPLAIIIKLISSRLLFDFTHLVQY